MISIRTWKLLLLLAAAAPVFAQTCTYSYSQAVNQPINIGPDPLSGSITVTTQSGCAWLVSTDVTWLGPVTGGDPWPSHRSGTDTAQWAATANPSPTASRTGHVVISSVYSTATFTVVQAAPVCSLALTPSAASLALPGGPGTFQVQSNCGWAVSGATNWLTLTPPLSGSLTGTVNYTAAANGCQDARNGVINVTAGGANGVVKQHTINQAGADGNLFLTPTGAPGVDISGIDGIISVTTGSTCGWTAYSEVSWITLTGSATGTGSGTLRFHVAANTSDARTGIIHVGKTSFTVTQYAAAVPAAVLTSVLNGGSYATGPISPGEVVAVFGSNIGPGSGVSPSPGALPTLLGGTQVLFDGTPAPLLYASSTQVNAVVPYGVKVGSTQVQVKYQSSSSSVLNLPVQAAAPGLLALDRSGSGPGAILNQDYSVNSASNPAARGTYLMIYCVGGGATNPPGVDGSIIGLPPPTLALPAFVTIGNVNADVSYSGAVYTSIAGLTQINALIPPNAPTGSTVPLTLRVGTFQAQSGITVAIK